MEEMINRLFEELAKQTERAVRAESTEASLRAVIEQLREDVETWKQAYLKKAEEKDNDLI